jgi:hypothetical protein
VGLQAGRASAVPSPFWRSKALLEELALYTSPQQPASQCGQSFGCAYLAVNRPTRLSSGLRSRCCIKEETIHADIYNDRDLDRPGNPRGVRRTQASPGGARSWKEAGRRD